MKKKIMRAAAIAAILAVLPAQSFAGCCGEVAAINQASGQIVGAINDTKRKLEEAIATAADAIKGEATQVAGEVADNRDKKRVGLANAEDAARAQQDYGVMPPNPCDTLATASISDDAARAADRWAAAEHEAFRRRGRNTSSPASAAHTTYSNHRQKYCSDVDVAQGRCSRASDMPDADVDPRSLTQGAGLPGSQSYVFSPAQQAAARAYAGNVVQPLPRPVLPGSLENTDQGRSYEAMRLAEQAKLGLAAQSFAEAMSWRAPASEEGRPLAEHIRNIWSKMVGVSVPPAVEQALRDDQASYFMLQKAEVDRRANNPEWYSHMLAASPAAVEREIAFMLARLLEMQHRQELREERQELLLAGILAETVRANGGQIDAQYRAAAQTAPRAAQ